MHVQNLMNSLWDTRIFLGLVPKESPCININININMNIKINNNINSLKVITQISASVQHFRF